YQTAPCYAAINDFSTGTIFSPNYPEYYPNDKICTWKLQVPIGFAIYMDCTKFKFWIENSVNCQNDLMLISLNGRDDFADGISFCGRRPPPPFRSFDNTLTILFKSNPWYHYTGFRCDFQAVPIGHYFV
uniref:CUB domain-containing protein n=1 Tax=Strigamia maritima TaxID=126957 RepID=T1JIJ3_STRMM